MSWGLSCTRSTQRRSIQYQGVSETHKKIPKIITSNPRISRNDDPTLNTMPLIEVDNTDAESICACPHTNFPISVVMAAAQRVLGADQDRVRANGCVGRRAARPCTSTWERAGRCVGCARVSPLHPLALSRHELEALLLPPDPHPSWWWEERVCGAGVRVTVGVFHCVDSGIDASQSVCNLPFRYHLPSVFCHIFPFDEPTQTPPSVVLHSLLV